MLATAFPILPVLILIAVIVVFGGFFFTVANVWDRPPWFRTHPSPRRQVDDARDQVKIHRIHSRHPEAFRDEPPVVGAKPEKNPVGTGGPPNICP